MQRATSGTFPSVNYVIDFCWILYNKPRIVATFFFQRMTAYELCSYSTYPHFRCLLGKRRLKIAGCIYPTSRGFFLAWLLAFTKSFAWLACRVVGLVTRREKQTRVVNKPTTRQTSHANDFVNAKSHAREKPLLAG